MLAMGFGDRAPPPPPPVVRTVDIVPAPRIRVEPGKFYAPPTIPPKAARILDDPQLATVGVIGGLPGPSGGPNRDGVVGSVMEKVSQFVPPPPPSTVVQQPKPTPAVPIRVTSGVLAANLIHKVVPTYPPLARQARISGTVRLQGVIAKDGRIRDLQLLSGHPLLAPAALDAVRQWVYRPTLLNGDPVEVTAPIDVIFTLGN